MELFIKIRDGQPFEHPILGDNFRQAFPDIDVNNLPLEYARFEKVSCPSLVYATLNDPTPTYQYIDGVAKEVWDITPMTTEEITIKQNDIKTYWAENGFASWTFNEITCAFDPPSPHPVDGKMYRWDEETSSWINVI